tara:strand:- start:3997 stop:6444 length:2448 start_codon:yes stop_codon:yes gene_type:complete
MTLEFTEPLFLLSAQTGLSVSELRAQSAEGNPDVSGPQAILKTGEPIPIVFCRRRAINSVETGGAMIAPKATEGFFTNDLVVTEVETGSAWTTTQVNEEIVVKLLLVVSQGQIGTIQVRDMFYGNCRRGTYNQAYNARAGSWAPGNTIDDYIDVHVSPNQYGAYVIPSITQNEVWYKVGNWLRGRVASGTVGGFMFFNIAYREHKMPTFCGTSGSYSGLTTLSFEISLTGSTDWNKQISAFVRDGLQVERLTDGTTGASDNFADLAKYLMLQSGRLPSDLIDDSSLGIAANFTNANNFLFNGVLAKSQNLSDWLQKTSYNFLLRLTNTNGKFGLKPRLPYNTDHTIKTTAITPEFTFTEDHVLSGGFEIDFVSLEDREPVCVVAQWRQQPEADYGLVRTINVRYQGEAVSGPFVSMDLSGYCVTENHAIKAATYKLATRKHVTHHLRIKVRERNYNSTLEVGDIVRVRLKRETSEGEIQYHDKVYEIARIEKTFGSLIKYDLTHFPIDSQGRSIVAQVVDGATGAGNVINVGRSTHDCDTNSSTSTSTVGSTTSSPSNPPSSGDTQNDISDGSQDSPFPGGFSNFPDPIDDQTSPSNTTLTRPTNTGYVGNPALYGNVISFNPGCPNARIQWYLIDTATGAQELVSSGVAETFIVGETAASFGKSVLGVGCCPDPSAPGGYSACTTSEQIQLGNDGAAGCVRMTGGTAVLCIVDTSGNTVPFFYPGDTMHSISKSAVEIMHTEVFYLLNSGKWYSRAWFKVDMACNGVTQVTSTGVKAVYNTEQQARDVKWTLSTGLDPQYYAPNCAGGTCSGTI